MDNDENEEEGNANMELDVHGKHELEADNEPLQLQ